jgi:hypothetical protein
MQLAFQRGRLRFGPEGQLYLSPNLDIIPKTDASYGEMARLEEAPHLREAIQRAQKNFLKQAVYELYTHNRIAEGEAWLKTLRAKYPDAVPANLTLTEYAIARAMGDVQENAQVRMSSLIEAFVTQAYVRLLEGEDDQAAAFMQRAQEMYDGFVRKSGNIERLKITPLPEVKKQVRDQFLDPTTGLTPEARAVLRAKLGLPAEGQPSP